MVKKISFEDLKPVKFAVEGEIYTMSAAEFARICNCAVEGSPASVKEKIAISKMTEDQMETIRLIGTISAQYAENRENKKSMFQPSSDQLEKEKLYQKFMEPYIAAGKADIGRYIFSGSVKTEEEALAQMEQAKEVEREAKIARAEAKKRAPYAYDLSPMNVETDKGTRQIPVYEFIRICPCGIQLPPPPESEETENA
ncbi:MAG: hypothetical protein V2A55_00720 [Candidatus Jorgensenbacteria bacterium]